MKKIALIFGIIFLFGYDASLQGGSWKDIGKDTAQVGLLAGGYLAFQEARKAAHWTYNRWFRDDQKHIDILLKRIKAIANEIDTTVAKIIEQSEEFHTETGNKLSKALSVSNMIKTIANLYNNELFTAGGLNYLNEAMQDENLLNSHFGEGYEKLKKENIKELQTASERIRRLNWFEEQRLQLHQK